MVALDRCLLPFFNLLLFSLRCFGFLDIEEIRNTHYGIELLKTPVVMNQDAGSQMVLLSTIHGQRYRCNYPDHSNIKEEAEGKEAEQIGIPDLLKPMEDGPCIITTKDWWTYEFCYGKYLQQYHMEDGVPVGKVLYLGFYESEYNWKEGSKEETKQNKERLSRYHSQQYVNGTVCDLTNKPRKVEVRFLCEEGAGDYISRIDEPESCVYVLTVHTTKICHHPYLKPLTPTKPLPITCNPVLDAEQYQEYLDDQGAERAKAAELAHEKLKYSAEANTNPVEGSGEKVEGSGDPPGPEKGTEDEGAVTGSGKQDPADILKTFKEAMVSSVKKEFGSGMDAGSDTDGLDLNMHFKVVKNPEDIEKLIKELQASGSDQEKQDEDDLPAPKTSPPVELMPSEHYIDRSLPGGTGESARDIRQKADTAATDPDYGKRMTKIKTQMEKFSELIHLKKTQDQTNAQSKEDKEIIQEFDKGVEQLIKDGHVREKMAAMKNDIKQAVANEFGDIVNEAQAELQRDGFDAPINRKAAFVNLASTLNKLLSRLEKSNKELDEIDKRLRVAADAANKRILEQRVKSAEALRKMQIEEGPKSGLSKDELAIREKILQQIEKSNTELEKRLKEAEEKKLADENAVEGQKSPPSGKQDSEPGSAQEQEVKSAESSSVEQQQEQPQKPVEEKEDNVEPHKPEDSKIKVRVTKVKFKDPSDPLDKSADPTSTKGVLGDAQKQKLENSVREELKKAGLDKSGKKIHIKIITSMPTDGTGFQSLSDEDSAAFNKMIVTILGGNQDEVREAERQQQFEDSYNFVYKPTKKKKVETPAIP